MNNNEKYTMDDIMNAWQQQGNHIQQIVKHHPITKERLNPRARHIPLHRRLLITTVARILACCGVLVWLLWLTGRYVTDTPDLISQIIIGFILLYVIAIHLHLAVSLPYHPILTTSPSTMLRLPSVNNRSIKVATLTVIISILLVIATPAYDGRTMSVRGFDNRKTVLAKANQIIENINTTAQ